jgi:hypothetical protein
MIKKTRNQRNKKTRNQRNKKTRNQRNKKTRKQKGGSELLKMSDDVIFELFNYIDVDSIINLSKTNDRFENLAGEYTRHNYKRLYKEDPPNNLSLLQLISVVKPVKPTNELQELLKKYPNYIHEDLPTNEEKWDQEKVAFYGSGILHIELDWFIDISYNEEMEYMNREEYWVRNPIWIDIDMKQYKGILTFGELIKIIHTHWLNRFYYPLEDLMDSGYTGNLLTTSVVGAYTHEREANPFLTYDGFEIRNDKEELGESGVGEYYFIKFTD